MIASKYMCTCTPTLNTVIACICTYWLICHKHTHTHTHTHLQCQSVLVLVLETPHWHVPEVALHKDGGALQHSYFHLLLPLQSEAFSLGMHSCFSWYTEHTCLTVCTVYMYTRMRVCTCTGKCMCVCVYMHMYTCMRVCTYTMYMYACMYMYMYVYTCTCAHVCMYMYMYVCTYMYMYMYTYYTILTMYPGLQDWSGTPLDWLLDFSHHLNWCHSALGHSLWKLPSFSYKTNVTSQPFTKLQAQTASNTSTPVHTELTFEASYQDNSH